MARTIAIIVGSIRKDSINLKLAKALAKLAPADFECEFVRIADLPVYNQDLDQSPPEAVPRVKSQIASANALLFVTPEHNRSLPTALKRSPLHSRARMPAKYPKPSGAVSIAAFAPALGG